MKYFMIFSLMMLGVFTANHSLAQAPSDFHNSTEWNVKPSLKYDALCLINILTGDPFYVQYYEKEYEEFSKKITPEVKPVLEKLLQIKQSTGIVLSAAMCLYYSAVPDSTLDQLIETTRDLSVLKQNFSKTVYFNENDWAMFEMLQEDVRTCFMFLKEAGFDVIWAGNFVDQGFFETQQEVNDQIWVFDGDLAQKSFEYVADKAPHADAYLANGMCNFRRASDGLPQRFVALEVELEATLGKPVITHDNALYWRIMKTLGIAPITQQGSLLASLSNA